jgi:hypothetical protein
MMACILMDNNKESKINITLLIKLNGLVLI